MTPAFSEPTSTQQAWLVSAGRVLASAEVAISARARRTGLIGRSDLDGAFVIPGCNWVHTFGMKFPLDIAFVDSDGTVIKTTSMARFRLGVPIRHASMVIEARRGAFERWNLALHDVIDIRGYET